MLSRFLRWQQRSDSARGFGPFLVFKESTLKKNDFEIRTSEITTSERKLIGYVVRWNSKSEVIWDEFIEQFSPGAFANSLAGGADVRALFEHNPTQLLGRTKSGTLVLAEDDIGLRFELSPPDTQLGNDVLKQVERGDLSGMSFGFRALKDTWDISQVPYLRTVSQADLSEITVTSLPAYPESGVAIAQRSLFAQHPQLNQLKADNRRYWADLAGL